MRFLHIYHSLPCVHSVCTPHTLSCAIQTYPAFKSVTTWATPCCHILGSPIPANSHITKWLHKLHFEGLQGPAPAVSRMGPLQGPLHNVFIYDSNVEHLPKHILPQFSACVHNIVIAPQLVKCVNPTHFLIVIHYKLWNRQKFLPLLKTTPKPLPLSL